MTRICTTTFACIALAFGTSLVRADIVDIPKLITVAPQTAVDVRADCPAGQKATGGGFYKSSSQGQIAGSKPLVQNGQAIGWIATVSNNSAIELQTQLSAIVICQ